MLLNGFLNYAFIGTENSMIALSDRPIRILCMDMSIMEILDD